MRWTVGMAVYDDPKCPTESVRAAFTAMSLLTHHPSVAEVLVVDNNPLGPNSEALRSLIEKTGRGRYVPMASPQGTAPPRNRVFAEAANDFVACVDPHVLLTPGFFDELDQYYYLGGLHNQDLLHAPMLTEDGQVMATHMNDQWREEMWGTWGRAWQTKAGQLFSVLTRDDKTLEYVTLPQNGTEQRTLAPDEVDALGLPWQMRWPGHEKVFFDLKCTMPLDPFQVPGHGMGFFACRKDAWLPFHDGCRGFGGEEMTSGYRFRQAGRRVWCVPGAGWWHHFSRPAGVPYRLTVWDKVRNYVLEFRRLGLSVGVIKDHFGTSIPDHEWRQLLAGKDWPDAAPGVAPRPGDSPTAPDFAQDRAGGVISVSGASGAPVGEKAASGPPAQSNGHTRVVRGLDGLYRAVGERLPGAWVLRDVASRSRSVAEVGTGDAAVTTALLAGRPAELATYDTAIKSHRPNLLKQLAPKDVSFKSLLYREEVGLPACDALVVTAPDRGEAWPALAAYAGVPSTYLAVAAPLDAEDVATFMEAFPEWGRATAVDGVTVFTKSDPFNPNPELKAGMVADPKAPPPPPVPDDGPGTELRAMLSEINVVQKPNCDCNAKIAQMNRWGVAGCKENRNTVVGWMRDGAKRWGWKELIESKTFWKVLFKGWAWKGLLKRDPYAALVDGAITRAGAKAGTTKETQDA